MRKGLFLLLFFVGLAPALSAMKEVKEGDEKTAIVVGAPKNFKKMPVNVNELQQQQQNAKGWFDTVNGYAAGGKNYLLGVKNNHPKKSYAALAIIGLYLLNEAYLFGKKKLTDDEESRVISELRTAWWHYLTDEDAKKYIAEQWDEGNKWLVVSTGIEIIGPTTVLTAFVGWGFWSKTGFGSLASRLFGSAWGLFFGHTIGSPENLEHLD